MRRARGVAAFESDAALRPPPPAGAEGDRDLLRSARRNDCLAGPGCHSERTARLTDLYVEALGRARVCDRDRARAASAARDRVETHAPRGTQRAPGQHYCRLVRIRR